MKVLRPLYGWIPRTHTDSGQSRGLGDVSIFLSWGLGACHPDAGSDWLDVVQQRNREHIYLRLLWCITAILSRKKEKKKIGQGHWLMASLTEEQGKRGPKRRRRESDYFLAKWFWLELRLNIQKEGWLQTWEFQIPHRKIRGLTAPFTVWEAKVFSVFHLYCNIEASDDPCVHLQSERDNMKWKDDEKSTKEFSRNQNVDERSADQIKIIIPATLLKFF